MAVPTVREADGLALSSRNGYLTAEERQRAPLLAQAIAALAGQLEAGQRAYAELERATAERLAAAGFRPDYISIRSRDLLPPTAADKELIVLAAAWLGPRARLIDNRAVSLE